MKDKELTQLTKNLLDNYQASELSDSLIELYFSYTSITSDQPVQFQSISKNVHGLIKFLSNLSDYKKEDENPVRARKPRKASTKTLPNIAKSENPLGIFEKEDAQKRLANLTN